MIPVVLMLIVVLVSAWGESSSNLGWMKPIDYQQKLGIGLDVDWSKTTLGRSTYSKDTVIEFRKRGFSHVRIRIKDEISDDLLASLDKQIKDCLDVGMIPVIAYQADDFKNSVSEDTMLKAIEWWRVVSKRYQDYSPMLSFDLIIEVTDLLNKRQERLDEYFERTVEVIRESNPQRILFISPRVRSSPEYLGDLKIPTLANGYLMVEWHFYAAGPSKTNKEKKWTDGNNEEKKIIQEKIQYAITFQEETGIMTWVGAWMPSNYNDGNDYSIEEQEVFAKFVSSELQKAKIPYAVNSDDKYYDRDLKKWKEELVEVVDAIVSK